ncbi:cytochrome P450 [Panus rudis PR-1116 ss-1]|nr:cytochrome P450 [Panus rudis PR-1116 ss-1]
MPSLSFSSIALTGVAAWVIRVVYKLAFARNPLDNLPGPPRKSALLGNVPNAFSGEDETKMYLEMAKNYGLVNKLYAWGGAHILYVSDPAAVHSILVKDQSIYDKLEHSYWFTDLLLGKGLLSTRGEQHRRQRKILNPVFNINHMRYMLPTFFNITHKLRSAIAADVSKGPQEIDMLNWLQRTALELVGQGGLGHSFDDLEKDELNPFVEQLKVFINTALPFIFLGPLLPYLAQIGTPGFRRFVVNHLPFVRVRNAAKIAISLWDTTKGILETKRAAFKAGDQSVTEQVEEGKDIFSVLFRANLVADAEDQMPDDELIGNMTTLIFAAMETTSSALARALYVLAERPDVQQKLRNELLESRAGNGDISYDELVALPYLDAVCREILRRYPPVVAMVRQAKQDASLPLSFPVTGVDGTIYTTIPIRKNTPISVGIWHLNLSPAIWGEDAEEFKPERWLSPLPETVTEARIPGVYSHLLTFNGGTRACIGFKFAQLEMKVVLATLVSTFKFELPEKEIKWHPTEIQYPTVVGGNSSRAELPLRVSLVDIDNNDVDCLF